MATERSARFDALYTENSDPWNYLSSDYERQKYETTLAALPRPFYRQGLEIGCSIGVLSRHLAARSEKILAVDISSIAIRHARSLGDLPENLTFMRCDVPREWPAGRYDLIVLSEVLYFLYADEIDILADRLANDMVSHSHAIIVNWLGDSETASTAYEATSSLKNTLSLRRAYTILTAHQTRDYALELLELA